MSDIEWLVAVQEIWDLKARRDHAVDRKDWDVYIDLHTEDHVADSVGSTPVVGGAAAAILKSREEGLITVHHSHTPVIEFQDAEHATGVWTMEDNLFWKKDGEPQWLRGFGFYHERYVKRGGRWLFCYRRLDRIQVTTSDGHASKYRIDRSGENVR